MGLALQILMLMFVVTAAHAADDPACARAALRERMARDLSRLRKTASADEIMAQVVEAEIAPSLQTFIDHLQPTACESRSPATAVDPSRAPEWNQYGELFFQARLKWKEAKARLPAIREAKSHDDETVCRVRRSLASTDDVLARFKDGCSQQPKLGACAKPNLTAGLLTQKNELQTTLDANHRRYRDKWGKDLLEKLACR